MSRGLNDDPLIPFVSLTRDFDFAETGHFLYWYMGNIAIVSPTLAAGEGLSLTRSF